jgi:hypothetical protein
MKDREDAFVKTAKTQEENRPQDEIISCGLTFL